MFFCFSAGPVIFDWMSDITDFTLLGNDVFRFLYMCLNLLLGNSLSFGGLAVKIC